MPSTRRPKSAASRRPAKRQASASKQPAPRLAAVTEETMTDAQRKLRDAIWSGPRGKRAIGGPFAIWLHAPEFGDHAQRLGAHVRYNTALPPRLSEFAILVTARQWRAQFEWYAHAPIAADAGVKPQTIRDLQAGRIPKSAPKDERALYDFITELYRTRRVSDRNYARVRAFLDDSAIVELIGIIGYYAMIAMTLNTFRAPLPDPETKLPFREPAGR